MVLDGVDIDLPAGSTTALMGRSGSGKTTLLRALALIELPDAGDCNVLGRSYSFGGDVTVDPSLWPDVTVVFQDLFLWPHLTCGQNVSLPATRRDRANGLEAAAATTRALGIEGILGSYPNQISRGQRQLVALARALALRPKVLLLDEITASLDVETSAIVGSVLADAKSAGTAILLITHQLEFARGRADYFAYLHDGHIVEQGPSTVLSAPKSPVLREFLKASRLAP